MLVHGTLTIVSLNFHELPQTKPNTKSCVFLFVCSFCVPFACIEVYEFDYALICVLLLFELEDYYWVLGLYCNVFEFGIDLLKNRFFFFFEGLIWD